MTIEERLTRIENALIAEGRLTPNPVANKDEILRDLKAGDSTSFEAYMRHNGWRRDIWPFAAPGRRGRKKKQESPPGVTGI
jgi:hypothetical protein